MLQGFAIVVFVAANVYCVIPNCFILVSFVFC